MGGRRPCFAALVLIPAILSLFLLQGFARNVKTAKFDGETFRTVFPGGESDGETARILVDGLQRAWRQHQSPRGLLLGQPLPGHPPPPPPPQSVY